MQRSLYFQVDLAEGMMEVWKMIEYDAAGNLPRIRSRLRGDRGNRGILYQWLINRVVKPTAIGCRELERVCNISIKYRDYIIFVSVNREDRGCRRQLSAATIKEVKRFGKADHKAIVGSVLADNWTMDRTTATQCMTPSRSLCTSSAT